MLAVVASLAAACGEGSAAAPARLRIAVVPKGTAHDFWQSVHAGALAAAAELQVDVDWIGPQPEGDREAQIRLVETSVGRRVHGLALAPVDARALAGAVAEAKRAGVPTVVFDSALDGDAHVAFVATDNRRGGELAGEALGTLLGGKGKVVVLRYQEGSASTMEREAGCLDTLRARFPGVQIVSDSQHGPSLDKARVAADALLLAHADVDGVFTPNESTTHAMLSALDAAGRAGKVKFVGFDASPPLVAGLAAGTLHALVVQDPVGMGRRAVELVVGHLRGETVPRLVHTDVLVATPQNHTEPAFARLLAPGAGR
jgi:ribose transport system substrate-binding protein